MLDQLAQGLGGALQNAAGVYDPSIFQANLAQGYDRQKLVAGAVIRAVENGALEPEKGQQILQKIGYADVPLGPSAQTQEMQRKTADANAAMQEEARIHKSIFSAPDQPDGTGLSVGDESQVKTDVQRDAEGNIVSASAVAPTVSLTYEKPEEKYRRFVDALMQSSNPTVRDKGLALKKELDTIDKPQSVGPGHRLVTPDGRVVYTSDAPDQAHTTQYERALDTLKTLQLKQNAGQKLTPSELIDAQNARSILQQTRYGVDPVTGQLYGSQGLTIPPSLTVGAGAVPGPGGTVSGVPINRMPNLEGGRKGLDAGTEKELNQMGDSRAQLNNIVGSFKPDYGGLGLGSEALARTELEAGRRGALAKYQPAAQWWEQYEQYVTDVRAAKFGMALTGPELAQFERYRANPSQSDKEIRDNIQRQQQLLDSAIQRRLKGINTSGQNLRQAESVSGATLEGGSAEGQYSPKIPPQPQGGEIKKINPADRITPDQGQGFEELPDGKVRETFVSPGRPPKTYVWPSRQAYESWLRATKQGQ